jgi:hypothetical protein
MTETIASPHANGPAPQMTTGDAQLITLRRGHRELFLSSWLRTPSKVTYSGRELEGTLLEFCSTGLIMQAGNGYETLVLWDAIQTVALQEYGGELMKRATRVGEDLLEVACYHTAVERGYWDVSNAYRAQHPRAAESWEHYTAARNAKESLTSSLMKSSLTAPKMPNELSTYTLRSGRRIS